MIDLIIQLLNAAPHYGQSEAIEIAKGKYKLSEGYKELKEQSKRAKAWQRKQQEL